MFAPRSIIPLLLFITLFSGPPPGLPGVGHFSAWAGGEDLNIGGSLRASWWSAPKDLSSAADASSAALWLKSAPELPVENAALYLEGWLRDDALARAGGAQGELREGYFDLAFGDVDLRIGRQIIAWGKADGLNPTDNLAMRDYTLMAPEDADQRSGAAAVKGTLNSGDLRLTLAWLPEFRENRFALPPGIAFSAERPANEWKQWAVKAEYFGSDHDWSLSYFDGLDKMPDLAPGAAGVLLRYGRIRAFGADGAMSVGRYGLRAEAAYLASEDASGSDPFVKNGVFYAVAGGDRTFLENLNVNVQYAYRQVFDHRAPGSYGDASVDALATAASLVANQYDEIQHGMTFRVNNKWFNETLEAEVAGAVWFRHGDSLIRPKVKYAVNDAIGLTLGADIYGGPKESFFGQLTGSNAVYAEGRYNF